MIKHLLSLVVLLSFALASCKKEEEKQKELDQSYFDANDAQIQTYIREKGISAQPTGTGVYYHLKTAFPNAQKANDSDSVRVHFKIYLLNNETTPIDTTSEFRNLPDRYLMGVENILPGLEDALRLMREGEEATILVPSYRALGRNSTHNIPPYAVLRYELKLVEVKSEFEQMHEFITKKGLPVTEKKDSVRRIRLTAGSVGKKPSESEKLYVNYIGRRLNGTRFDQSIDTTYTIFLNQDGLIPGFKDAVRLMEFGETSLFVFPSTVAYGRTGSGTSIPAYCPLSFQLTLVKPERLQLQEHFAQNVITDTTFYNDTYYKILTPSPTGAQATTTSTVKIKYKNYLLDGTPVAYPSNTIPAVGNDREDIVTLSTSETLLPWAVVGLRDNVALMRVGETRRIWVTSVAAHGATGKYNVRRRTPIVYEVTLVSIQ